MQALRRNALKRTYFRLNWHCIPQAATANIQLNQRCSQHSNAVYESCTQSDLFGEEHAKLRQTVKKIIDKDINPYVEQWEEEGKFDAHALFKKLGNAGLLGITRPVEYGGLGLDYSFSLAFFEELSTVNCAGVPMAICAHTEITTPALTKFGSDELKREFLAPSIAGDVVSCLGVSESGGGSDVANIKTKAVRKGDDLIINGEKMWITNGAQADWMCMLANTSEGPPHKNKSLICVPLKSPGVHVSKVIKKIGNHSSDTAQLFFEDVRVPAKNIIGEEGMGFLYQMMQFQEERLVIAAMTAAGLHRAIWETIEYCQQRKTFGKPLIENQVVHFRLAEMQAEVEMLRSQVYRAASALIQGQDVTLLATMAKLKTGQLARRIPDECLQLWGGMGYSAESMISRMYRDMRLIPIGGGADEVMLGIICKYMGILPKAPAKQQPQ